VDPGGDVHVDVKGPEPRVLQVEVFDHSAANDFVARISQVGEGSGGTQVYGFATAGQPGGDFPLLSPESSGGCGCVAHLGPQGEEYGSVDGGCARGAVAVDPANGHVFVDDQSALTHSVSEWDTG